MTVKRPRIKVLVVDDHRVFAEAVAIALGLEPDITAKVASSGPQALAAIQRTKPSVVLMDLEMPGMGGLAATRQILATRPEVRVIVVSAHDEDIQKAAALEAGAIGYLSKLTPIADVGRAVRQAHHGGTLIEPTEMTRLLRLLRHRRHQESTERQRVNRLTPRQVQILQMIAHGSTPRQIADILGMSPLTLRTHVQNILTRLAVHTKLEAVAMGVKHGKISVSTTARLQAAEG
jgi:DNA-binding NarL/FixJ family response regulator